MRRRFRSLVPEKILSKIEQVPWSGCWIWMGGVNSAGYGVAYHHGQVGAHRLSYLIFVGDPGARYVLHHCDVPACVNPGHLHLGDHLLNMQESWARDRQLRGMDRPSAKLTDEKVRQIKASPLGHRRLAAAYGVARKTIEKIKAGRTWKHVE